MTSALEEFFNVIKTKFGGGCAKTLDLYFGGQRIVASNLFIKSETQKFLRRYVSRWDHIDTA